MLRPLKPCIRCEGTGKVAIEIYNLDIKGYEPAGTAKCHGCGGTGEVPVGEPCEVERILAGNLEPEDAD
jgi:hypothetical protein